jgi:site-specific DNA recombinase
VRLKHESLVDVEWRALTYAGCTVWNQTQSRGIGAGGYQGGSKRRPRAEWQIQRATHEALIDEPRPRSCSRA